MIGDKYIKLWAYHGTSENAANNILVTKTFLIGAHRHDHWLGNGVYFYREDFSQAMTWAIYKVKNKLRSKQKAAVIEVLINVKSSDFLNLDTRDGFEIFCEEALKINEKFKNRKIRLKVDPHVLMCFYCDELPKKYKLIQRTFRVSSTRFDGNKLFQQLQLQLHGTQLCVRDTSIINSDEIKLVGLQEVSCNTISVQMSSGNIKVFNGNKRLKPKF
ncbi:hypothetical protein BSNK01_28460 [Bacillaceae bacterium]